MTSSTIAPELAKAIVEAQRAADVLIRDGLGDKGKYTTGDAIAAETRRVLNLHGAAWVLLDATLQAPSLAVSDIGQQHYVGDIVERWAFIHESGAMLSGGGCMPVVTSRGRPHDKAVGASLTYGVGQCLRGALNLVREDKNAIDKRKDDDVPADVQPEASAKACRAKVEQLAALTDSAPPDVWALWCERLKFEPMQDGGPPTAFDLTTHEGQLMWDALEGEIRRIETRSSEPDGNPATASPAPYLARKGARCGGRASPLGAEVRKLVDELGEQLGKAWGATWAAVLRKDGAGIPPTVEPEQLLTVDATRLVARLQTAILNIEAKAIEREPGDDADEVPEDDAAELARVEQRLGATFPGTTKASPSKRSRAEAPS
jgi:hypothetical protein